MCIGRGPEWDADDHGYKSNLVIATKQFERAQSLWSSNATTVQGKPTFSSHSPFNFCQGTCAPYLSSIHMSHPTCAVRLPYGVFSYDNGKQHVI